MPSRPTARRAVAGEIDGVEVSSSYVGPGVMGEAMEMVGEGADPGTAAEARPRRGSTDAQDGMVIVPVVMVVGSVIVGREHDGPTPSS